MTDTTHLWDVDHPFYGATYNGDFGAEFDTWAEFVEDGQIDGDRNALYRWDWLKPDPDEERPTDELHLFYVAQHKGYVWGTLVRVTPEDEASVREYLTARTDHLRRLWEPISLGEPTP